MSEKPTLWVVFDGGSCRHVGLVEAFSIAGAKESLAHQVRDAAQLKASNVFLHGAESFITTELYNQAVSQVEADLESYKHGVFSVRRLTF